ncbi:MAG TPA: hypothetical protein VFO27_16360 [Bryobacteraceae bacterium]|nr:hypothetical protein [Bryobacteraceae bacterium]
MTANTPTQERILQILREARAASEASLLPEATAREAWLSPLRIAERYGKYATAGGCARSLRVLLDRGLVRQRKLDHKSQGGFELFVYAIKEGN